jgi:hypothetical protein
LDRRAEAAAGAPQADHDAVVRRAAVLEVGDRRVAPRVDGQDRAVEAWTVGDGALGAEGAARRPERDRQARAADARRSHGTVGQRDGARLCVGGDRDRARRRGALSAEGSRPGRAGGKALAGAGAGTGSGLPRPPRERRPIARRDDGDRVDEEVRRAEVLGRRPRRVGDRGGRQRQGQERTERGEEAEHGPATDLARPGLRGALASS